MSARSTPGSSTSASGAASRSKPTAKAFGLRVRRTATCAAAARSSREYELPLSGSIRFRGGDDGPLVVTAKLPAHRVGALIGFGALSPRVRRRFDQLFGELLNDLEVTFGAR